MRFVAFDIETTGFLPRVDHIVEIAAVRFEGSQILESFSTLIQPPIPIPPEATRVHGITNDMVRGKPTIDQALIQFSEFCGTDTLVAHNAPFDVEFIKADVEKHEVPAPAGLILDSCLMARKVIPGAPNYRLGTLVTFLQISANGNYHRAEADSRYCGQLFSQMLTRIFKAGAAPVIENLVNLSGGQVLRFPQVQRSHKQMDLFI
ncbi:MAG: 3'-5' exonuclease [Oligoflexia bacterium]|nr:3'-5' exonuclease [Oligoflexia bacterium]